jgi:hypothetical protein
MTKVSLVERQVEGRSFYLWKVGSEDHERPSFCVWVNPKVVKRDGDGCFIFLPLSSIELQKGKKDLILKLGDRNLFDIFIKCGYRGSSRIDVISPGEVYYYYVFSSPRGNLGISQGALVLTDLPFVKFRWERTGRLYGAIPTGISVIHLDGTEEQIESEDALASSE